MTGNPADGFEVILDEVGRPFPDGDAASEAAETCNFRDSWWVVQASPLAAEEPGPEKSEEPEKSDDLPRQYVVAVYYRGDEGAWHFLSTWSGCAPNDSTAESLALDALEDPRIDGWKAEVVRFPEPPEPEPEPGDQIVNQPDTLFNRGQVAHLALLAMLDRVDSAMPDKGDDHPRLATDPLSVGYVHGCVETAVSLIQALTGRLMEDIYATLGVVDEIRALYKYRRGLVAAGRVTREARNADRSFRDDVIADRMLDRLVAAGAFEPNRPPT